MIEDLSHPANVIAPQHNQILTVNKLVQYFDALLNIEPCSPAQLGHAWRVLLRLRIKVSVSVSIHI